MAYVEDLCVREPLTAEPAVTEKAMSGGLSSLPDGTVAVGLAACVERGVESDRSLSAEG